MRRQRAAFARLFASVVTATVVPLVSPGNAAAEGGPTAGAEPITPPVADPATAREQAAPVVLSRFSTRFLRDTEHRSRARNLGIAAAALDGAIVAPGEVFSFNQRVGERTARFGYEPSVVYRDAQLAQGTGGGTCQVASTLHAAALLAGLAIVVRSPHSRPSAYIRMGLDATVAYPHVDLKLKNPRAEPVVLRAEVVQGRLDSRLDVWIESSGPRKTVTLTSTVSARTPPGRTLVRDPDQPPDVVLVRAYGIPGYQVQLVRAVRDAGGAADESVVRDVQTSEYPPTPEVLVTSPGFDPSRLGAHHPDRPTVKDERGALHPVDLQLHPQTSLTISSSPAP